MKPKKRIITIIIIQNIFFLTIAGLFFYFKFYKPIYNDQYLFPEGHSVQNKEALYKELHHQSPSLDIKTLNPDYIIQENGLLEDLSKNKFKDDENFGLTALQIKNTIYDKKINFIDIREIEEYQAGHIKGSIHYRGMDLTLQKIKEIFDLDEKEFNEQLFVLVCHDGGRGQIKAKEFNKENIKYLIKGIEGSELKENNIETIGSIISGNGIFNKDFQNNYQTTAQEAIKMINSDKNITIIDGRDINRYNQRHIKTSIHVKIGHMTTPEYENALQKILDKKENRIIILADRYSELFYANLLILRLKRYYDFKNNQFYIIFHQFKNFIDNPNIELEES